MSMPSITSSGAVLLIRTILDRRQAGIPRYDNEVQDLVKELDLESYEISELTKLVISELNNFQDLVNKYKENREEKLLNALVGRLSKNIGPKAEPSDIQLILNTMFSVETHNGVDASR